MKVVTILWTRNWRETTWSLINQPWDVIVIGGGITGAGVLREATRLGLRCLLVEQRDFAWGASSRSSKLIHGGLRYLVEGKLRLTREAVRERERLLKEGTDLVQPVGYLFPIYRKGSPRSWSYRVALSLYDLLAAHRYHRHFSAETFQLLVPHIDHLGLTGGISTREGLIDDARLVLRVLQEAVESGGTALNYVRVQALLWDDGRLSRIRSICQGELNWNDTRWEQEEQSYLKLVRTHYGLPDPATIPDWHKLLIAGKKKVSK